MTQVSSIPVSTIPFQPLNYIDRVFRRDLTNTGLDLVIKVESDCETFNSTGKTTRKLKGIWVEWLETHWYRSSIDIPSLCIEANEPYGDVCRFGRWYKNETFAKAFAMTLMLGQKTTEDITEYECWEGDDPRTDLNDTTEIIARRFGGYSHITEDYFDYHWHHKDFNKRMNLAKRMRPDRLLVLNYEFEEEGGE